MLAAVVAAFAVVVALLRLRAHISVALLTASAVLLAVSGPAAALNSLEATVTDPRTWFLVSMSYAVAVFADLYDRTGLAKELGEGLAGRLRSPLLAIALTPAVLGLIPVAGGALMSAPLVAVIGSVAGLGTAVMIYANVWFRHTIFLVYPLSNVLITTAALTGYGIGELAARQAPVATFMIAVGALILWPHLRGAVLPESSAGIWRSLTPLAVALGAAIALRYGLTYLAMPLGVALGAAVLAALASPSLSDIASSLASRRALGLAVAGFSIMLFQKVMTVSGASEAIAAAASSSGLPVMVLEVALPAAIGILTGSPLTGIVTSIPILAPITDLGLKDVSLIYVSSIVSYIGSPAHLCLVYTAQYFGESIMPQYRYMLPSIIATMTFAVALYMLW